jgi:hypothetical protein
MLLLGLLLLGLLHGCCGYDGLDARDVDAAEWGTVSSTRSLENNALHALADRWESLEEERMGADILLGSL